MTAMGALLTFVSGRTMGRNALFLSAKQRQNWREETLSRRAA
jgi:hypothetical protein